MSDKENIPETGNDSSKKLYDQITKLNDRQAELIQKMLTSDHFPAQIHCHLTEAFRLTQMICDELSGNDIYFHLKE